MFAKMTSSALVRDLRAESRELGQSWLALQDEVEQLERHKNLLRHEWQDLEEERERAEKERQRFEDLVAQEWFPAGLDDEEVQLHRRVVGLNVGGQKFDLDAKMLLQDRFSLLAATCLPEEESTLVPDDDGYFFFDRDWFIFRHIVNFLQDGTLPKDPVRLRELHREAAFYCLGNLQREIQVALAELDPPDAGHGGEDSSADAESQSACDDSGSQSKTVGLSGYLHSSLWADGQQPRPGQLRRQPRQTLVAPELPDPFGFTSRGVAL